MVYTRVQEGCWVSIYFVRLIGAGICRLLKAISYRHVVIGCSMSEDVAGDGNSSRGRTSDTTGMKGGEAGTAMSFGNAKIENLSIKTYHFGSDDSGQSKQEPKQQEKVGQQGSDGSGHTKQEPNDHDQEKEDFGDAVLVSISGRKLKTIQRLDSIPVQDGVVSVRGTYSNQNVETTATCEKGKIVHLEAKCGKKTNADAPCRSIWTLAGIARDATFSLIANSYSGLRHITNAVKDKFGVRWVRMRGGSLIFEFGHDTKEHAEQMVSRKDEVALLFKTLLGKYNIKDDFRVNCEIMYECDVVPELPTCSTEKEGKGKQYAASQSDSGNYSKSSRGEPSQQVKQVVDTDSVLAVLLRDEDVDGCDECRHNRDDRDPDVHTNKVVIHFDVGTVMGRPQATEDRMLAREIKQNKIIEMARKFSAVRNSGGGCILCHICGRDKHDRNLYPFDEHLSTSVKLILGEGEFYSKTIQREWHGSTDFVIIKVSHTTSVCTASVNSYVVEWGFTTASLPQLKTLLFGKYTVGHGPPLIRGLGDLQEGVDKQFKGLGFRGQSADPVNAPRQFYRFRVQCWISAFSKNPSGGSLYIGIPEEAIMYSGYRSSARKVQGCPIPSRYHTAYTKELKTLVRENMMIMPNIHTKQQCDLQDLVDVAFHHVREDNYVIEISVRPVNGCVFTDQSGPFAYKLDEKGSLCRMSFQEWMEKLRAEPRPT